MLDFINNILGRLLSLLKKSLLLVVDSVGSFRDSFEGMFFLFGFSFFNFLIISNDICITVVFDGESDVIVEEFFPCHSFLRVWLKEFSDETLSRF